uniref:Uncharacterized protein n=1 Tax=Physcomitrium patens TaxID=3218 RepID=A0A2K1KXS3_PHYPA|nr:hypothetical protein PHYPA_005541 [Physcomitrium patens]
MNKSRSFGRLFDNIIHHMHLYLLVHKLIILFYRNMVHMAFAYSKSFSIK